MMHRVSCMHEDGWCMLNDDGDTQIVSCRDGYLVRQEKMCAVARQDVCCDKARSLLWQGTREPQRGAAAEGGRPPLWRRPKAASLVSCHNRGLVLPQQTSCVATAHLSCGRTRDPSYRLSTTNDVPMLFGHNSTLVAPVGASMGAK